MILLLTSLRNQIHLVMLYHLQCLAVNTSSVYLRIDCISLILVVFYSVFYRV